MIRYSYNRQVPRPEIEGRRMVMLEESEYDRLLQKADEWEPPMPEPDADGNYPALEACRVSIARSIIRERKALGLTQERLAHLAGVRQETLSRLESGKHSPTVRTVEKIELALQREARRQARANGK